ncbi:MAG: gluconate 2-dehydrogenase subunit 3 family protein [Solirubrobacteraceae bacterium]
MEVTPRRREFVVGGALAALGLVAPARVSALIDEVVRGRLPDGGGRFLSRSELEALRAVTARLLPGPPDDPGPGALKVHAAEAIDLLLGAFELDPPLIHAGGPFSGRAGGHVDDFAHFVALDAQAELGWRIRLEGSRGLREREFAGPVTGLQEIYRAGLARLEQLSRQRSGHPFAQAPAATQDALLASHDDTIARFVNAAVANSLEALCGPPEYGGNHALAGWRGLQWRGDSAPDGYTRAQVTEPDPPTGIVTSLSSDQRMAALERIAPLLWRGRSGRA